MDRNNKRNGMQAWPVAGVAALVLAATAMAAGCACPAGRRMPDPAACTIAPGRTEQIHRAVADWLVRWPEPNRVKFLTRLAESSVSRLAAGGTLFVTGDPGFCDDMNFRAGGLAGVVVWDGQKHMGSNDVLLVGWFDDASKSARAFMPSMIGQNHDRIAKAMTIVIASARWPLVARMMATSDPGQWPAGVQWLDTDVPSPDGMAGLAVAQAATTAAACALEGEMIAAASRANRTLAFYPSIFAPGGQEFGRQMRGRTFLDSPQAVPIPAGQMARYYLEACRGQLQSFCASNQPEQVRRAAGQVADCQRRGGTVLTVVMGHLFERGTVIPPELRSVVFRGPAYTWKPPQGLRSGDLFCYLGYLDYPKAEVEAALGVGAEAVTLCVADVPDREHATHIRSFWKPYDGVVEVPGCPYKALPSSAVVTGTIWYSLMEEARVKVARQSGGQPDGQAQNRP